MKLRRVIWSELNKDYLETQAAKDAAVAAAGEAPTTAPSSDAAEATGERAYPARVS